MKILAQIFYSDDCEHHSVLQLYERFTAELSELHFGECNNLAAMLYNMKAYLLLQKVEMCA